MARVLSLVAFPRLGGRGHARTGPQAPSWVWTPALWGSLHTPPPRAPSPAAGWWPKLGERLGPRPLSLTVPPARTLTWWGLVSLWPPARDFLPGTMSHAALPRVARPAPSSPASPS